MLAFHSQPVEGYLVKAYTARQGGPSNGTYVYSDSVSQSSLSIEVADRDAQKVTPCVSRNTTEMINVLRGMVLEPPVTGSVRWLLAVL